MKQAGRLRSRLTLLVSQSMIMILFIIAGCALSDIQAQTTEVMTGTILTLQVNDKAIDEVREEVLALEVCCYLGYFDEIEAHALIVSSPNPNPEIAEALSKLNARFNNPVIEQMLTEDFYLQLGYRLAVTGEKLELD